MAKNIFRECAIFQKELNETNVKKIGYYFALEVKAKAENAKYISVEYHARTHSSQFEKWLTSEINHAGLEVLNMGLVPTPVDYFSNLTQLDDKTMKNYQNSLVQLIKKDQCI